jgi:type 1 glutamine amidotransferase
VFYTSLGHLKDFENPQFRRLLINAVFWAMEKPVPKVKTTSQKTLYTSRKDGS